MATRIRESARAKEEADRAVAARDDAERLNVETRELAADVAARIDGATAAPGPGPVFTLPTEQDEELYDQIDALDDEIGTLIAGGRKAWLEVYQLVPPPTLRRSIAQLDSPAAGQLRNDIVRVCQDAGKWGDLDLSLTMKAVYPGAHGTCPKQREHPHIVRNVGHYGVHVPRTEAAVAAAQASTSTGPSATSTVDPIAAAEKMLEAGKRLTPPATAPTSNAAEDAAKIAAAILDAGGKFAAMSNTSSGTKEIVGLITPFVAQIAQHMMTPTLPPPRDPLLEWMVKSQFGEGGRRREAEPGPMEELQGELMAAVIEQVRGGGGRHDRPTVGVELVRLGVPLLPRMVDRIATSGDGWLQYLNRRLDIYGAARRPVRTAAARPTAPAPAEVAASAAAEELIAVLRAASPWAEARDTSKFPQLHAALAAQVPGCAQLLEDLRSGRATEQNALDSIAGLGIDMVEPLAGYVRLFLSWSRGAPPGPAASTGPTVTGSAPAPSAPPAAAPVDVAALEPDAEPCDAVINGQPCGGIIKAMSANVGRCGTCGAEYTYRG